MGLDEANHCIFMRAGGLVPKPSSAMYSDQKFAGLIPVPAHSPIFSVGVFSVWESILCCLSLIVTLWVGFFFFLVMIYS